MKIIFRFTTQFTIGLVLMLSTWSFTIALAETTEIDSLTKIVRDFEAQGKQDTGYARALYNLAMANFNAENLDEATALTSKAMRYSANNTALNFSLHNSLGSFYISEGSFVKSLEEFKTALEIAISIPDKVKEGIVHYNLSNHYDHTQNDSLSYVHLLKAYDLMIEAGDSGKTFHLQNSLGLAEIHRGNYEEAKSWYDKSLELAQAMHDSVFLSTCYNNLANYYLSQSDTNTALLFLKRSYSIDMTIGKDYDVTLVAYNIATIYSYTKTYDSSAFFYDVALKHAKELGNFQFLESIYSKIFEANYRKNNFDTLNQIFYEYKSISDSILSQESINKYAETQNEIELITANKELEIMQVSQKSNRQKLIFMSLIAGLLLVVLIGSFIARKNLLAQKSLAEKLHHQTLVQKLKIEEQREELLEQNKTLEENAKAKDRIMSLLAHDLRTPFSSISNLNHLISEIGTLTKEQEKYIQTSNSIIHSGLDLISDILDIYKLENFTHFENDWINISQLLSHSIQKIGPNTLVKNQKIITYFSENLVFFINREMLQSAIDNLLSNASKYSSKNQEIIVSAEIAEEKLLITIKDFGQGFKKEEQEIIFDRFNKFTRTTVSTETSTGLGLYLVKGFVESLNGTISLNSEWGKGSTFTLVFTPQNKDIPV